MALGGLATDLAGSPSRTVKKAVQPTLLIRCAFNGSVQEGGEQLEMRSVRSNISQSCIGLAD